MKGMASMNDRNVQIDKKMIEIKQTIGGMKQKDKEVEHFCGRWLLEGQKTDESS